MRRPLLLALVSLTLIGGAGFVHHRFQPPDPAALGYTARTLQGFRLYLSPELLERPDLMERLEWRLEEELALVRRTLPEPQVRLLQANTPVFLEVMDDWESSRGDMLVGNEYLAYYRGRFRPWRSPQFTWMALRDGVPPNMGAVTVPHPEALIGSHATQSSLMIHEFAHAYDDLKFNFENRAVEAAYEHAHAARLYRDDLAGDHYADRNPREYFATLSEVYFSVSPTAPPPNTPQALKAHDPAGYAAVAAAWGVAAPDSAKP